MTFSVLHLSDLHRSPDEPIGNDELISALVADIDRWASEEPAIPVPQAIVVTGDLVRGVSIGEADAIAKLRRQYEDAQDFLERITERLLNGDRSAVAIVPGNHDVDWGTARRSMEVADPSTLGRLGPRDFTPESDLRWDWETRQVYRIVDRPLYESRFDLFNETVDAFFSTQVFSSGRYFHTFEFMGGRMALVGFNSCYGNDCFARHGAIPENAVANAHLEVRGRGYELVTAAWHHNVEGGPFIGDYMDVDTVHRLISKGFRVGLHGHQHRAEAGHRSIRLPEQEPIALISAGSLCAGSRELPPGVNRQFNVVEFAGDLGSARVHVRETAVATAFAASRRAEFGGKSFVEMDWTASSTYPVVAAVAPQDIRRSNLILDAESLARAGRHNDALELLADLNPRPGTLEHDIAVGAIVEGRLWDRAEEVFPEPKSVDELVLRVSALIELKRFRDAIATIERWTDAPWLEATVRDELAQRVRAAETMSSK